MMLELRKIEGFWILASRFDSPTVEYARMALEQRSEVERTFQATSVSEGIGMGRCVVLYRSRPPIPVRKIAESEIPAEVERFEQAILQTRKQIQEIANHVKTLMDSQSADIFESHLLVLEDQILLDEVLRAIQNDCLPADLATLTICQKYIHSFENISDDYFRQRVIDVKDVVSRLIDNLTGWTNQENLTTLREPAILVATDLSPSETVQIDRSKILGIITEQGGTTSHVGILARSLQIPAISGLAHAVDLFQNGQMLLLDGYRGCVILSPSEETRLEYGQKVEREQVVSRMLEAEIGQSAITLDGRKVTLAANLAGPEDVTRANAMGANGVGLFRTEFFFLNRTNLPTEDEQYKAYLEVTHAMNGKPVVIRTLDLGGDKKLSQLDIPAEENPFLGYRAIRFCLQNPEIFKVQLRALLRASAESDNLMIMYPMISGVQEYDRAQKVLQECMTELDTRGIPYNRKIEVGVMIEIPSAALCSDVLARKAKFFSIGTNDLIQYTLAVDRMNQTVSYLYKSTHPAVIRLIFDTVRAGRKENISVSVCGEMGGSPELAPLLIGLGVDELSVGIPQLTRIHRIIRKVSYKECRILATQALQLETPEEVFDLSLNFTKQAVPELFTK